MLEELFTKLNGRPLTNFQKVDFKGFVLLQLRVRPFDFTNFRIWILWNWSPRWNSGSLWFILLCPVRIFLWSKSEDIWEHSRFVSKGWTSSNRECLSKRFPWRASVLGPICPSSWCVKTILFYKYFNDIFRTLLRLYFTKSILAPSNCGSWNRHGRWGWWQNVKVILFLYFVSHMQEDPFKGMCCARLRNCIWKLTEDPDSSTAAKVLVCVSSLFLLTSIIMLILSTVPEFQVHFHHIAANQ